MQIDPETKQAVLHALQEQELLPVELMEKLEKELNLNDAAIKDAIWALMKDGSIAFASDHRLKYVAR